MIRVPQLVRTQCRQDLLRAFTQATASSVRWRTGPPPTRKPPTKYRKAYTPRGAQRPSQAEGSENKNLPRISPDRVPAYFAQNARTWLSQHNSKIVERLLGFGLSREALRPLLKRYVAEMVEGNVFHDLDYSPEQLQRLANDLRLEEDSLDRYMTKILFEWASLPHGRESLLSVLDLETVSRMDALFHAADLSNVGWQFPMARRGKPRRFIMHVGPTNSGKTHNALRALAAANRGIYAGPLRLLAYEIFDRLNKGQIVPLGVDPGTEEKPDTETIVDAEESDGRKRKKDVAITQKGNLKYARPCNMITGEERKVVMEDAPLLSCTVEMTPLQTEWDVAVIDEIQLIADRQRGGAWTDAILGLNAKEIHLCGEESAVPLVTAIVHDLGDSIEIKRYERLTPLVVADESLKGKLKAIKRGDCVVTFSRSGLFRVKADIEDKTKLRCALAYGRLPPEIRSEQAALFNDPNSDYHVLVGSDAVGMGLNLKIKRVIFETVSKWDGGGIRYLSPSQIKQIAGRAGRFGMHEHDSVGVVTTLHPEDLNVVRKALDAPPTVLQTARLQMTLEILTKLLQALPHDVSGEVVANAFHYVSKLPPMYETAGILELLMSGRFIDQYGDSLSLQTRILVQYSPCPWRDAASVLGAKAMMDLHRDRLTVPIEEVLQRAGQLQNLNKALALVEGKGATPNRKDIDPLLSQLETCHKIVVLYLWFTYRYRIAFPEQQKAFELRRLIEYGMDWCLEFMHQKRLGTPDAAHVSREAVLARRPLVVADEELTLSGDDDNNFGSGTNRRITPEILQQLDKDDYTYTLVR